MEEGMDSLNKNARLAGFLYLTMVITGPFVLLYVPGRLFVHGDAAATAANILANESLFRVYIAVGIRSELFFIATVLALYRLLNGVDHQLAVLMVLLVLLEAPLSFLSIANQIATLTFVRGADILAVFDTPQRDAIATLLVTTDQQGILVSELFWGLWLLPLGMLVFRSRFLPRFLGIWLFINGLAYVITSFTGILAPQFLATVKQISLPTLFGEVALMLWLLIRGARLRADSIVGATS
jgi:hypothetical protein